MTILRSLALAALVAGVAGCGPSASTGAARAAGPVTVADVVCRPTPTGRQVTGCYMTVTSPAADTLVSVATPAAALAQVHETRMESNMMMMRRLESGLALPARQAVHLAPGGTHLMLMGVVEPLRTGDTLPLTLTFANARPVEVTATVGQPPAA